jgi:hypothetical protein
MTTIGFGDMTPSKHTQVPFLNNNNKQSNTNLCYFSGISGEGKRKTISDLESSNILPYCNLFQFPPDAKFMNVQFS